MPYATRISAALAICGLFLTFLPIAPTVATPLEDTVFLRIPASAYDPAAVASVRALDYGSFFWLEVLPNQAQLLAQQGVPIQPYEGATVLTLPGARFDTRRGEPNLAPSMRTPAGQTGFHLVQLVGPVRSEWLPRLEDAGLTMIHYLAPFSYIVWGDGAAVNAAQDLDFVRWTGPYHPGYKISPQVRHPAEPIRGYGLVLYPVGLEDSLAQIHAWGGQVLSRYASQYGTVEMARVNVAIGQEHLEDLARLPNLYALNIVPVQGSIRDEMSDQIVADNHPGGVPQAGYLSWLAGKGVDGSGVTVAIVDTGTDYAHTDLGSDRLAACLDYAGGVSPPPACTGPNNYCGSHGTMTAGMAVGDGESGVGDGIFLYGLGMAPEAELVVQNFLCAPGGGGSPPPDGWRQLSKDTVLAGGYVQGNSWGPAGTPQGYDADTREFDFMPRDADPDTVGNEPMLFSLSIMNGNGGTSTQGTPDEGKNLLRVGATKNYRAGDIDDLCTCTAHGPALDGRRLPDIVAPGQTIWSATPGGGHSSGTGTSFASPHASGAAALFVQWYDVAYGAIPSPALIKAAFVNGADDLYGGNDADGNPLGHIPDNKQGWGRLNLERILTSTVEILYFDQDHLFTDTGQTRTLTLAVADPSKPFKVTLAWTDEPGAGLGGTTPAWVNDLDLTVSDGVTTWHGNVFASGWSVSGGSADPMNNLENVYLENPSGIFEITVQATNIPGDGVPGNGDVTDQDFALVCWNCTEPSFSLSVEPGELDFCAPDTVTSTVGVGQVMGYTETVTLEVSTAPAGVTAQISPTAVTPPGQATLTVTAGAGAMVVSHTLVVSGTAEGTNVRTAEVDLRIDSDAPAPPALLSPPNGADELPVEGLTFTWQVLSLARIYHLQLDAYPSFPEPGLDVTGIATATYTVDTPLAPSSCYFWRVAGMNACGEGGWAGAWHFATVRSVGLFRDDTESGPGDWTASGLWHITSASDPCTEKHSGDSSWYYGRQPQCDYDIGPNSGQLTLGSPIDLSAAVAPASLRFWSWEETEGNAGFDTRRVFLSSNGTAWTEVWESDNNAASWYRVDVDLSSYIGGDLYVRFEFDSGDGTFNDYRGWYVDDVEVIATLAPMGPPALLAIEPNGGPSLVEIPVTISGQEFMPTAVVQLDSAPLLSVTFVSSTTLEAVVPAGLAPGVYDLNLINGDCQSATLMAAYTVTDECVTPTVSLSSDSPVKAGRPAHLTATIITGTAPFAFHWDFGGPGYGSGLTTATPVYTYTEVGVFTVTLDLDDLCGSARATALVIVEANFVYLPLVLRE